MKPEASVSQQGVIIHTYVYFLSFVLPSAVQLLTLPVTAHVIEHKRASDPNLGWTSTSVGNTDIFQELSLSVVLTIQAKTTEKVSRTTGDASMHCAGHQIVPHAMLSRSSATMYIQVFET